MKNDKALLIVIVVLMLAFIGIGLVAVLNGGKNNVPEEFPDKPSSPPSTGSETKEFSNRLQEIANTDGLLPIEGYDADLLLGKISTLKEEDFDGVETFEGIYTYESYALEFKRTSTDGAVSSAEKTISQNGYATLLLNLKTRFNVNTVDEVIAELEQR